MPRLTAIIILYVILAAAVPSARAASDAPYDRDLQRLAEILGALHHLRAVCRSNEGQSWRDEMQALIDAEAPSGERRDRLAASFNRGYRGYQQTHRVCTTAAQAAIRSFLEEGARIARDVATRYAN